MKITISGTPGSGKTTVGKILSKKLKLKYYDVGGIRRKNARKMGLTLEEYNKLGEKDSSTDVDVDKKIKDIGKKQDNILVVGKLAYNFIPDSIKIYLEASIDTGARRIFNEKRKFESYKTLSEAEKKIISRMKTDKKRYKKYNNLDTSKKSNYDLVIDTTNLSTDKVVKKTMDFIKKLHPASPL